MVALFSPSANTQTGPGQPIDKCDGKRKLLVLRITYLTYISRAQIKSRALEHVSIVFLQFVCALGTHHLEGHQFQLFSYKKGADFHDFGTNSCITRI